MTRTRRRIRGLIVLATSAVIVALIYYGVASPSLDLKIVYLICAGVALWGLIEIVRSLLERS